MKTILEVMQEQAAALSAGVRLIGTVGDLYSGKINYRDVDCYLYAMGRMELIVATRIDCWLATAKTRSDWATSGWCCHYGMSVYGK
jgi:hypothetical protein